MYKATVKNDQLWSILIDSVYEYTESIMFGNALPIMRLFLYDFYVIILGKEPY